MQDQNTQETAGTEFGQLQLDSLNRAMADYKLAEEAAKAAKVIRTDIITAVRPIIEYLDIKPDELGMKSHTSKESHPPRFRNPVTGETWHGWGHRPAWIPSELKTKDLERFRIKD